MIKTQIVNYISASAIPIVILIIIFYGVKEKKKVFDIFLDGAKEGMKIVVNLFPTLIGIFLAVGALRNSGILDFIINLISPVTNLLKIPSQILPLAMLRPISGSASMGVAVDIMQKYGVDTTIGMITSVIMGSTETTFYTIAIYTACVKVKKIRFVLAAALLADLAGMIASVIICSILSWSFCWQFQKMVVIWKHIKKFRQRGQVMFSSLIIILLIFLVILFFSFYFILRNLISYICAKHIIKKISE